jgi:hypothetical protein
VIPFGKPQYLDIAGVWVQNMEELDAIGLELRIVAVDEQGSRFDDTCIGDVTFLDQGERAGTRCAGDE